MTSSEQRRVSAERRRHRIGRGVAGLVAASVVAWSGAAAAEEAARGVARGRQIAETACAPCHAIEATGTSPRAEAPIFRDLGRKYPVESLEEALAEGVVVGHPGMPEIRMSEPDVAAFLAWLKSIQTP